MSIEAMKQALDALEGVISAHGYQGGTPVKAITPLRQAIAEADQGQDWSLLEATQESLSEHMAEIKRLRGLLEQANHIGDANKMVEQAQPVAWMVYTQDGKSVCVTDNPADFTPDHHALPLYTAPPPRKPLTDEEIMNVFICSGRDEKSFARAIEAAHGITGENK